MRVIECPKCGKEIDLLAGRGVFTRAMVKSLLSGESQIASCPEHDEVVVYRLEGRMVVVAD